MALVLDFDGTVKAAIAKPTALTVAECAMRAERYGRLMRDDLRRALTSTYRHRADREALLARDLRCVVTLAQAAWCYALNALGCRETPCRCLVGGGHTGKGLGGVS